MNEEPYTPGQVTDKPDFINDFRELLDQLRTKYQTREVECVCFLSEPYLDKDGIFDYYQSFTFGKEERILKMLRRSLDGNTGMFRIISRAWYERFLSGTSPNDPNPLVRDLRRAIMRYTGQDTSTGRTVEDEAADLFRTVARDTPALDAQINVLRSKAKIFRRQGLHEMQRLIEEHIAALTDQLIAQRDEADRLELQTDQRHANALEALRVRHQRQEETELDHRLQHDYDSMTRRVRSYRTMIERLTREMEALQEEQRQMQTAHPQFDPHTAAKQKLRQMAERKRERAAHKKKGKEQMQDNIGSCSQMLRKIG